MFPQRLDSTIAYDIAKAMMDGFNRHYRLFRTESARAKHRFETASSGRSASALSFTICG
jgi:isocitrate dehydrogenase kinase/phosphatase